MKTDELEYIAWHGAPLSLIERCISNRYSLRSQVYWGHATEGDAGGVGAEAAAGSAAPGGRPLAGDRGADGGCCGERRLAVAGYVSAARRRGLGSEARGWPAAEADGTAAPTLAAAARARGPRPWLCHRPVDHQAGGGGPRSTPKTGH